MASALSSGVGCCCMLIWEIIQDVISGDVIEVLVVLVCEILLCCFSLVGTINWQLHKVLGFWLWLFPKQLAHQLSSIVWLYAGPLQLAR